MTISKIRAPRVPVVRSESVGTAVKKLAARATGYAEKSSFDPVKGLVKSVRRETMGDLRAIKSGLRSSNDAAVRLGVSATAARLGVKLPELSGKSGWEAFGALGSALGVKLRDPLHPNPGDYREVRGHVMSLAARINDPDPSNGRVL